MSIKSINSSLQKPTFVPHGASYKSPRAHGPHTSNSLFPDFDEYDNECAFPDFVEYDNECPFPDFDDFPDLDGKDNDNDKENDNELSSMQMALLDFDLDFG